jgi:hypothetical protein
LPANQLRELPIALEEQHGNDLLDSMSRVCSGQSSLWVVPDSKMGDRPDGGRRPAL